MKCAHCGTRIEDSELFRFRGLEFCCECMSMLTSWFLDGGITEEPEMFDYVGESS